MDRESTSELELEIERLENEFPMVSGIAFAEARQKVLDSGQSVLQVEDGVIYEVFPDGKRVIRKKIAAPTTVDSGMKIIIQ